MLARTSLALCIALVVVLMASQSPEASAYTYEKVALGVTVSGSEPQRARLQSLTWSNLEETYELMEAAAGQRRLKILLSGIPKTAVDPQTKQHSVTLTAVLKFYEGNKDLNEDGVLVTGVGTGGTADECYERALSDMASKFLPLCADYFATLGTVRDIDGDVLYLNRGADHGLKAGQVCEVMDAAGRKVALIEITSVEADRATARARKHGSDIEVGNTFQTRVNVANWGVVAEAFFVPAESEFGEVYSQEIATSGLPDITSAIGYRLGFCSQKDGIVSLGAGVLRMEGMAPVFVDLLFGSQIPVAYERATIFWQIGGGFLIYGGQPYRRPVGGSYPDPLPDSGETNSNTTHIVRGSAGLRLNLSRAFAITGEAGYLFTGDAGGWSATGGDDESYDLASEHVEYRNIQAKGVMFSVGATFLFGVER